MYANDHAGHGLTAGSLDAVGTFGKDCFRAMAAVMGQVTENTFVNVINFKSDMPLFVLGHSMGSFLTQSILWPPYMARHPAHVQGIILLGPMGNKELLLAQVFPIATLEAAFRGDHYRS